MRNQHHSKRIRNQHALRSKAFAKTILKIFWTLIECEVEQKIYQLIVNNQPNCGCYLHTSGACIAFENLFACLVISSCSPLGKDANWSYFVPINTGIAVLLNPRAWRYHSLTLFRVDFRVRSNMNRIATASLDTRGSIDTNSL